MPYKSLRAHVRARSYPLLPCVLNLPEHAPGDPAIIGSLPVPVKTIPGDVVPDHPLFAWLSLDNRIALEDHFSILERACEIQVGAAVIHPGLAPQLALSIIG